jgi:hypothetical protein
MAAAITTCTRSFLIAGLLKAHQPDHGYQLGARITTGVALRARRLTSLIRRPSQVFGPRAADTKGRH